MAIKRASWPQAVRFVQVTAADDAIIEYSLGSDCWVNGLTITARPTAGVPTPAQVQGITRVIGYKGNAREPSQSISLAASDPLNETGIDIFLDGNVGMVNQSGPERFYSRFKVLKEEKFCFEVRRGVAIDGSSFDVDIAITPLVEIIAVEDNQGYKPA